MIFGTERQRGWHAVIRVWWDTHGSRKVKATDILKFIEADYDNEIAIDGETLRSRATTVGKLLKAKIGSVFAFEDVRLQLEQVRDARGDACYRLSPQIGKIRSEIEHEIQTYLDSPAPAEILMISAPPKNESTVILRLINQVLDERERRDMRILAQRRAIGDWLDTLLRARESGDADALAAAVDEVTAAMMELIF